MAKGITLTGEDITILRFIFNNTER